MTSLDGTRHIANLRRDPRAAICVDVEAADTTPSGVRPNASVKARGLARLTPEIDGFWTRRITEKYVAGEAGAARARLRAAMRRVVIELRPVRLLSAGTAERRDSLLR
jgi:hypothetical protein